MRAPTLAALSLLVLPVLSAPGFAQVSAPPDPPQVTIGAGLKLLQFDWQPAPRATFYVMLQKPNATAPFAVYGSPILAPRTSQRLTVPVHTFDWASARFKVLACNENGCPNSPELGVQDLMLPSIGYFKGSNPDARDQFGTALVLSNDGNTLLVAAHDDSATGDPANNGAEDSGAAHAFRRIGNAWREVRFLKSENIFPREYFGTGYPLGFRAMAMSANGSVVAIGSPNEMHHSTEGAGVVYLLMRFSNEEWGGLGMLVLDDPHVGDNFGTAVDVNDDGNLVMVSSLTGLHLFRLTEFGFRFAGTIAPRPGDMNCGTKMSGDGDAIVTLCDNPATGPVVHSRRKGYFQDFAPPSFAPQQPTLAASGARLALFTQDASGQRAVVIYTWTHSQWVEETTITPPGITGVELPYYGWRMSFNRSGTMLAIADPTNSSAGVGVVNSPLPSNAPAPANKEGAVFLYTRGPGGWTLSRVVKAPNPGADDGFGRDVALSGNGLTLAVGAPFEDSAARGIDGDQTDNSLEDAGAVYLY